jgi:dihydropteroate synthase
MQPKDTFFSRKQTINCGGELIDLSESKVMAILNVTSDSFYDGGKHILLKDIKSHVNQMIEDGADIIDVGAYSSRPGAKDISVEEELLRLKPVLEMLRTDFPNNIISVDTFRSAVAQHVVDNFNVDIINDISAGELDEDMFNTIAKLQVPYIMMHMQGTPQTMQKDPHYDNVVEEIMQYFSKKMDKLKLLGINDVILDPGFGFGKTVDHNFQLLKHLSDFKLFELPVLVGVSRKSMINKVLEISPDKALNGTTVVHTMALLNGANILRVHDVKEAREAIQLTTKYLQTSIDNWYE